MNKLTLSHDEARTLAVMAQFEFENQSSSPEALEKIINKLGYVQIDTISVIQRSHHHVFWTRNNQYTINQLHNTQVDARAIFEYWGHAMAYLPMEDYRFFLPKMKNFENPSSQWARQMLQQAAHLMQPVLDRIRTEGPLSAKDFKDDKNKGGAWWDWKPAKVALELLFWKGDLMITERRKFQKVYDLRERVLPAHINTSYPTDEEIAEFIILKALGAYGLLTEKEICKFLQPGTSRDSDIQLVNNTAIKIKLDQLVEAKEISLVKIKGYEQINYYIQTKRLESISNILLEKSLHILSPFDNLIIQRERTKQLFGFDYRLECYVPEPKRKFGYFVLPVLWGNTFIGRMDPKADRKTKILNINTLVFEENFSDYNEFIPLFAKKLAALARFNDCQQVKLNLKGKLKKQIEEQIKKCL